MDDVGIGGVVGVMEMESPGMEVRCRYAQDGYRQNRTKQNIKGEKDREQAYDGGKK